MRTPWEQARFEAVQSAVRRNESRLQGLGEEPGQTSGEPGSPSAAAQAISLANEVLTKVKALVPQATQDELMKVIMNKVNPVVKNKVLVQPAPTPSMPSVPMGMTTKTMGILTLVAGAAIGGAALYFLLKKKSASQVG